MTQIDDLLARVLSTLATVYTKQAFDGVAGQIRKAFPSANQSGAINTGELHEMEEIIKKNPPTSLDIQSNIDTLSRWFEIPSRLLKKATQAAVMGEAPSGSAIFTTSRSELT